MKTKIITLTISVMLLANAKLLAQPGSHWSVIGNGLTSTGIIGSTTNFPVTFRTNNLEHGRLTTSGLWGFGTSFPNAKVHINGAAGQTPLRVQAVGVTKFLVNSAGNVGIGTLVPQSSLHVTGSEVLSTGFQSGFKFRNRGSATAADDWVWYSANNIARFWKQGTGDLLGITPTGNVGIGTTAPEQRLHVVGDEVLSTGGFAGFKFRNRGSATSADDWVWYSAGNVTRLYRAGVGDLLGITTAGNVGIGTTVPGSYKLRVSHNSFGLDIQRASSGNHWELYVTPGNGNLSLLYNNNSRGYFNATTGAYTQISDARLKTNIQPMPSLLDKINQLKPTTYQFKTGNNQTASSTPEYGFIAQDVQKVFPHLVTHNVDKERELDAYTVDYSGFGVLAIKGIQELQQTIQEQQKINSTLTDRIAKLEAIINAGGTINGSNPNVSGVSLEQNQPNPFNQTTTFRYTIPSGVNAQIMVYDALSGALLKSMPAPATGQVELNDHNLKAGTYIYSLVVNGKQVDSKRMVLLK